MSSKNIKVLSICGLLGLFVLAFYFVSVKRSGLRLPASSGEPRVISELLIDDEFLEEDGLVYVRFVEDSDTKNICDVHEDDGSGLFLQLVAEGDFGGTRVFSESGEDHKEHEHGNKVLLEITYDCVDDFASPIFRRDFCDQAEVDFTDDDGVTYKLVNGFGIFPKAWKVKDLKVDGESVSLENQLSLSEYVFNCPAKN